MMGPLGRAIERVREQWRSAGVRGLARMARENVYWRASFVRFYLSLPDWIPPMVAPPELEIHQGTLGELEAIRRREASHSGLPLEFRADLIHGFDRFYLGSWNGDLAHIAWVLMAPKRSAFMSFGPGQAEITFSYTLGQHRGRQIYTHCTSAILSDLKRQGVREVFGHVLVGNDPSQRGMLRVGYTTIGMVTWWRFLGARGVRYRPFARDAR